MQPRYIVMVEIPGLPMQQELCMCTSPESAAEVVRALLAAWGAEDKTVTVKIKAYNLG